MHIIVGNNDWTESATSVVASLIRQAMKLGLHDALTPQRHPDFSLQPPQQPNEFQSSLTPTISYFADNTPLDAKQFARKLTLRSGLRLPTQGKTTQGRHNTGGAEWQ